MRKLTCYDEDLLNLLVRDLGQKYGRIVWDSFLLFQRKEGKVCDLVIEGGEVPSISASVQCGEEPHPVYIGPEGYWCRCRFMTTSKSPCKHLFYLLFFCADGLIGEREVYNLIGRWG